MVNFQFRIHKLIICILVINILSCGMDSGSSSGDNRLGPQELKLATIDKDSITTSTNFNSEGFSKFKKETDLYKVSEYFDVENPYVKVIDESTEKFDDGSIWVPYWEGSTDSFKIYSDFILEGDWDIYKDIGFLPYLDPYNNNSEDNIGLEFWASFDKEEDPNGVPSDFDEIYFYMERTDYTVGFNFQLTCEIVKYDAEGEENIYKTNFFKVKRDSSSNKVRFGDDMVLNFQMKQDDGTIAKTFNSESQTNTNVDNFLGFFAIIDDKLLRKANQFIDTGGDDDWNDLWGEDFEQVDIPSWTPWDTTYYTEIVGSVAYSSGGADSVSEFIADMNDQVKALNIMKLYGWSNATAPNNNWDNYIKGTADTDDNPFTSVSTINYIEVTEMKYESCFFYYSNEIDYDFSLNIATNVKSIDFEITYDDAFNYVNVYVKKGSMSSELVDYDFVFNSTEHLNIGVDDFGDWSYKIHRVTQFDEDEDDLEDAKYELDVGIEITLNVLSQEEVVLHPYRPGYGAKILFSEDSDDVFKMVHDLYSAGLDCSGFVQQAANYNENKYNSSDRNGREIWKNSPGTNSKYKYRVKDMDDLDYVYEIQQHDLIPGDLLVLKDNPIPSRGDHVIIVQDVTFSGTSREVNESNVQIIEAASGDHDLCVINYRNWVENDLEDRDGLLQSKLYLPMRLKLEE